MLRSDCHPTRSPDCGGELGGRGRLHVFRALDEGPPGRGDGLRLLQALLLSRNIEPAVKRQAASASVPKPQPLNLFIIYFETLLHSWAKATPPPPTLSKFVGKGVAFAHEPIRVYEPCSIRGQRQAGHSWAKAKIGL